MKEHTGKQGFAALCMSLFFIFLFFGSALFTAQMAQNIQGISLRSRFCDDTSLRTPESAGTIPLAAGKSQLKNRSPDTAVLRRRRRKLCCAAGSDSVSCSFCGIPPQSGFPPLHPFLNETLSRQGRPRILKKQKEHSAIPVYKYRIAETALHQFRIP